MIQKESFSEEHIRKLQEQSRRDPALIERTIYAFGLLEAVTRVEMPFIFKGGTCLMLLLKQPQRLSTDIDIIVEPGTKVEDYIEKAAVIFPFVKYEEQIRVGKNQVEKRHFKFIYESPVNGKEFYILLDVLYEKNNYTRVVEKKIKNNLLLTEHPFLNVTIPSIECILGDKLTAFAPHTIGIPLHEGKDMEVMKQMYDIATLIDAFEDFEDIKNTYQKIALAEIAYRGKDVTLRECLKDTLYASMCIVSRGRYLSEEYSLYVQAIRDLRGHIYLENYTPEIAVGGASKVAYMAACLLTDSEYVKVDNKKEYIDKKFIGKNMVMFKYLRKVDLEAYAYMIKIDRMLESKYPTDLLPI